MKFSNAIDSAFRQLLFYQAGSGGSCEVAFVDGTYEQGSITIASLQVLTRFGGDECDGATGALFYPGKAAAYLDKRALLPYFKTSGGRPIISP
jgi:hypothetical protein